ncbi:MAG: hypothetical protein N5P05_001965 [Chroococcopsis gigantea SAG 12.99]|jgi:hypothetical protein|nr:DUF1816 domain-containing protein [Chlorogloea purpurea SAG 13.99]MDV3000359.1 hypothetical protein [Chroococcopsis gigantea SAG 12.99]
MKELLISLLDLLGLAFWVEIKTDYPRCTYYFGPFLGNAAAAKAQAGYIEDLQAEGSQGINVKISRCKPKDLTVFDEKEIFPYKTALSIF